MRTFFYVVAISVAVSQPSHSLNDIKTDNRESIADYWFRTHVVEEEPVHHALVINEKACVDNQEELDSIWQSISAKVQSPLKSFVEYVDQCKNRIASVFSPAECPDKNYKNVSCSNDYIKASLPEIRETMNTGYKPTSMAFDETQTKPYLLRQTLAHEEVRLCGIDEHVQSLILTHLFDHLRSRELSVLHLYYFGSRVMPRSEVIKRDPAVAATMPINDDGVIKNAVRIKGLTHISDLEVMVLVTATQDKSECDLKKVSYDFKRSFSRVFRDFPVSVKLIFVKNPDDLPADPFDYINRVYEESKNKIMSRYQYVKIF